MTKRLTVKNGTPSHGEVVWNAQEYLQDSSCVVCIPFTFKGNCKEDYTDAELDFMLGEILDHYAPTLAKARKEGKNKAILHINTANNWDTALLVIDTSGDDSLEAAAVECIMSQVPEKVRLTTGSYPGKRAVGITVPLEDGRFEAKYGKGCNQVFFVSGYRYAKWLRKGLHTRKLDIPTLVNRTVMPTTEYDSALARLADYEVNTFDPSQYPLEVNMEIPLLDDDGEMTLKGSRLKELLDNAPSVEEMLLAGSLLVATGIVEAEALGEFVYKVYKDDFDDYFNELLLKESGLSDKECLLSKLQSMSMSDNIH